MTDIQKFLFENQDLKYRDFSSKLIPTVPEERIIGVRAPVLKAKAKQMYDDKSYKQFTARLPHKYHEENMLHGYILCRIENYDETICEVERFLPFIDNWAVCDTIRPRIFRKYHDDLLKRIKKWIIPGKNYENRFAIGMLLSYFLDDKFDKEQMEYIIAADSEEYYISMMAAWYFATALAKQYDSAVKVIEEKRLLPVTHNRTIQKAVESYRVPDEKKEYLKQLKIKK